MSPSLTNNVGAEETGGFGVGLGLAQTLPIGFDHIYHSS